MCEKIRKFISEKFVKTCHELSIIDLIGVVRQTEKASQNFMPKNAENTNKWSTRDVEALASKLETLPIFIDAAHSSSVMNGPVAGQTRCSLPNDHLAYLITWYVKVHIF